MLLLQESNYSVPELVPQSEYEFPFCSRCNPSYRPKFIHYKSRSPPFALVIFYPDIILMMKLIFDMDDPILSPISIYILYHPKIKI